MSPPSTRRRLAAGLSGVLCTLTCLGCTAEGDPRPDARSDARSDDDQVGEPAPVDREPRRRVTLAFVGDMHFQIQLAGLLEHPQRALGPVARTLRSADITMANLESAVTTRGSLDPKELEEPDRRFWFRAPPSAFRVLHGAGIDVVTMANNPGADYGPVGLADTLSAVRDSPVDVIGIGRDERRALAPARFTVRGTRIAFLAADASPREGSSSTWSAGRSNAGVADVRAGRTRALVTAVEAEARRADVVVVYLHWGTEDRSCPDQTQRRLAATLSDAGADVVVGAHAHRLQGAGFRGGTYVAYGLGNFLWYHDGVKRSGVLRVRIEDGAVVGDDFVPAEISPFGRPVPVHGRGRSHALRAWERLRACTRLTDAPG
jgi:poly-gamma-glutamate capsule biosynthesis protein CapA/YwtB (metallophosphatase superfamily)